MRPLDQPALEEKYRNILEKTGMLRHFQEYRHARRRNKYGGTIYELKQEKAGTWKLAVVHTFTAVTMALEAPLDDYRLTTRETFTAWLPAAVRTDRDRRFSAHPSGTGNGN
jgi:hypothetical protein